jgi:hypothetical protein
MPFSRLLQGLRKIEAEDPRVAVLLRSYLAGFRDIDPEG